MEPLTRRGVLGRADLVPALAASDQATAALIAQRLGLERSGESARLSDERSQEALKTGATELPAVEAISLQADQPLQPARFWYPHSVVFHQSDVAPAAPSPLVYRGWTNPPRRPPLFHPLTTWSELAPRLRRVLSDYRNGKAVDVERTVQAIGRGHILTRFPRERRRRWGPALMLLDDDSRRLIPFRLDRRLIRRALARLLPAHAFGRAAVGMNDLQPHAARDSAIPWPPPLGTLVLALTDLGALAVLGEDLRAAWLVLGRDLLGAGCFPLALFPGPLERCPHELAAVWRLILWERPRAHDGRSPEERRDALLRLVSPAARIEPGLLRAARLLLPGEQADAATEADVWQHPALAGDSPAGATIDLEQARAWRAVFSRDEPLTRRRQMVRLIKAWRHEMPPEIWFDELLNVDADARTGDPELPGADDLSRDLEDARAYFHAFCDETAPEQVADWPESDQEWLERIRVRSTEHLWADPVVGRELATRANELARHRQDAPSDAIRADQVGSTPRAEERWALRQQGQRLIAVVGAAPATTAGSPLAEVGTRGGRLDVQLLEEANTSFWLDRKAPSWARSWGWDEYGAWVEFSIEGKDGQPVTQRMRWIEPGRFRMGSPEAELERYFDEGPQHEVTIRDGFWLFDTACTQGLWEAVMDENPSLFKGADRPVEQVSWEEVQRFIKTTNARLPGLGLSLPSEAQWEYACRAGTDTPFSFGSNITPDQVNYDGDFPAHEAKRVEQFEAHLVRTRRCLLGKSNREYPSHSWPHEPIFLTRVAARASIGRRQSP